MTIGDQRTVQVATGLADHRQATRRMDGPTQPRRLREDLRRVHLGRAREALSTDSPAGSDSTSPMKRSTVTPPGISVTTSALRCLGRDGEVDERTYGDLRDRDESLRERARRARCRAR